MNSPLKCAVVGVGYLGKFHVQKYTQLEEAQLIAVSDIDEQVGRTCAEQWGVSFFEDYRDLVGRVEAVTVATPTPSHYEVTRFFLENGIHVHVEKPLTARAEQGEELCELAEKNHLKLQVGHVERFNPALVLAREKITNPLFIECHRLSPFKLRGLDVSVILDLMIHDLDIILSLVKSKVVHVSAVGNPVLTKTIDMANARIQFASGVVANITSSRVSQGTQRRLRVFQPDGYISIDFGSGEVSSVAKMGQIPRKTWNVKKEDALLEETRSFVATIQNHGDCVVSGREALMALRLAERVTEEIHPYKEGLPEEGLSDSLPEELPGDLPDGLLSKGL